MPLGTNDQKTQTGPGGHVGMASDAPARSFCLVLPLSAAVSGTAGLFLLPLPLCLQVKLFPTGTGACHSVDDSVTQPNLPPQLSQLPGQFVPLRPGIRRRDLAPQRPGAGIPLFGEHFDVLRRLLPVGAHRAQIGEAVVGDELQLVLLAVNIPPNGPYLRPVYPRRGPLGIDMPNW